MSSKPKKRQEKTVSKRTRSSELKNKTATVEEEKEEAQVSELQAVVQKVLMKRRRSARHKKKEVNPPSESQASSGDQCSCYIPVSITQSGRKTGKKTSNSKQDVSSSSSAQKPLESNVPVANERGKKNARKKTERQTTALEEEQDYSDEDHGILGLAEYPTYESDIEGVSLVRRAISTFPRKVKFDSTGVIRFLKYYEYDVERVLKQLRNEELEMEFIKYIADVIKDDGEPNEDHFNTSNELRNSYEDASVEESADEYAWLNYTLMRTLEFRPNFLRVFYLRAHSSHSNDGAATVLLLLMMAAEIESSDVVAACVLDPYLLSHEQNKEDEDRDYSIRPRTLCDMMKDMPLTYEKNFVVQFLEVKEEPIDVDDKVDETQHNEFETMSLVVFSEIIFEIFRTRWQATDHDGLSVLLSLMFLSDILYGVKMMQSVVDVYLKLQACNR